MVQLKYSVTYFFNIPVAGICKERKMSHQEYITQIAQRAREISYQVASRSTRDKNQALEAVAREIENQAAHIISENTKDISYARETGMAPAMIDRLLLNEQRIAGMVKAVREIISLTDPVGSGDLIRTMPNGLQMQRLRVPLGVVAMIYESRPNVTSDAAALTLKSGNTVILRGGKEAIHSNTAIAGAIRAGLKKAGYPEDAVQFIDQTDREIVDALLQLNQYIDVVIPRGGEGLIRAVSEKSRIPVIKHDKGVCHVYIDQSADRDMANAIVVNSKVQRPSVCNAAETVLFHKDYPWKKETLQALKDQGVEIRADAALAKIYPGLTAATEEDWSTEYLALIISAREVNSVQEAIDHINHYGSHHSDSIVTADYSSGQAFVRQVDSAAVYINASTRFTDGEVFGLGAEIGISTQKLHVRGPMGLDGLTSQKWVIFGQGQVR